MSLARVLRLAALSIIFSGCVNGGNTITGPDETIVIIRVPTLGSPVADFIFTQRTDSDDVSLAIQNISQSIASFNYTINFSVSGQGWTDDGSVNMLGIGATENVGLIAVDSPTILESGYIIVLTSVVLDGVTTDSEVGGTSQTSQ